MDISKIEGFEWDLGNNRKNELKHHVSWKECEEVFFNKPLLIDKDLKHSLKEKRLLVLGKTNEERLLFVSFTFRKSKIRVISARAQNKREKVIFNKHL